MQRTITIVCLALLLWVKPASAQQVYSLKVSIHKDVPPLTRDQVDQALGRASDLLKEPGNQCNVTLKRNAILKIVHEKAVLHGKEYLQIKVLIKTKSDTRICLAPQLSIGSVCYIAPN